MKKQIPFFIALTSLLIISGALFMPHALAIDFDPNNNIAEATDLPDEDPVSITVLTIQWILGFLGLIAVLIILYGGFTWMTSAGNEEKIAKAKKIIQSALIGMIVILLSWAIVTFVFSRVSDVTT